MQTERTRGFLEHLLSSKKAIHALMVLGEIHLRLKGRYGPAISLTCFRVLEKVMQQQWFPDKDILFKDLRYNLCYSSLRKAERELKGEDSPRLKKQTIEDLERLFRDQARDLEKEIDEINDSLYHEALKQDLLEEKFAECLEIVELQKTGLELLRPQMDE